MSFNGIISNDFDKALLRKPYSVMIGLRPSEGARSPQLWNSCLGDVSSMVCCDVDNLFALEQLYSILSSDPNCQGGAVTAPYKSSFLELCDHRTDIAARTSSCNNFYRTHESSQGFTADNTDGVGFLRALHVSSNRTSFSNFVILGNGSVSKTIRQTLLLNGQAPFSVYTLTRKPSQPESFIYNYGDFEYLCVNFDLDDTCVVNATSVGDYTNEDARLSDCIINLHQILHRIRITFFFECIHTPPLTPLILDYAPNSTNGRLMNLYQAVVGFKNVYPGFPEELVFETMAKV
jgi:shikimate 5-dehydrogenase